MPEEKARDIFMNMMYTIKTQERRLNAYKRLGSPSYLKYLRDQEIARRRRKNRVKRAVKNAILYARNALILWTAISLLDLLFKFATPNPVYLSWNLFTLLF